MIEIAFVGDIMLSRGVGEFLSKHSSHTILTDEVQEILAGANLCVGNLESPVAINAKPTKQGSFKTNPESLKQVDVFDIFSLANNHINDCGALGVTETIVFLKTQSFEFLGLTGIGDNAIVPLIKNIHNKKFSFFACAVPYCIKNKNDEESPKVINATDKNLTDAINGYSRKADYTIVLVHGGNEMIPYPEPSFRALCENFIINGADIVVTSHPHVLGGFEEYKNGLIFYSLGDFVFDADSFLRRESAILKLKINNKISWEYIPVTITNDFKVIIPDKRVDKKIHSKINLVANRLKSPNYAKKYSDYYQTSLQQFQKDRLKYKLKNKGFLHTLFFLIQKATLIPHYFKKLVFKLYK